MAGYCETSALYDFGLPRGATPNPGRNATADASTDAIELDNHALDTDTELLVRAEAGHALPSPLAKNTTYYAKPLNAYAFQVAATPGGAAIDLTTAGGRFKVIVPLPIEAAISWGARIIDDMLPAHLLPLTSPYPEIVAMTNAELAANKLLLVTGGASASLGETIAFAQKRLERWAKGVPIRNANVTASANLSAKATTPFADARGWNRYGGL